MDRYLTSRGRKPGDGWHMRDVVLHTRIKGRNLAKHLPSIGEPAKWLERKTDDDTDYR